MKLQHRFEQDVCIVSILGELEWDRMEEIRRYVLARFDEKTIDGILIDYKAMRGLDSKGIGVIMSLFKTVATRQKRFGMCSLSANSLDAVRTVQLDNLIDIFPSPEEGLSRFSTTSYSSPFPAPIAAKPVTTKPVPKPPEAVKPPHVADTKPKHAQPAYHPLLVLSVNYFFQLQEKFNDELSQPEKLQSADMESDAFPLIVAEDGCRFDEISVQEALAMCKGLQDYLNQLSPQQLKELQAVHPFYKTPQSLLDKLKLFFMGDVTVKEKIVRIYGAKAFGTYKITRNMLSTSDLFAEMNEKDAIQQKEALLRYAEESLKAIKNLFPRSVQENVTWTRKTLAPNIQRILAQQNPLFRKAHNYKLIVKRFQVFVFGLYADTYMQTYLTWKDRYLRLWLFSELYQQDIQNMLKGGVKIPQYTGLKIKIYQQLDTIFSTLEGEDTQYDKSKLPNKTQYSVMSRGEAFLSDADPHLQASLKKARESEKALLDSLSLNQVATIAEWVHKEILKVKRSEKLDGELPSGANTRTSDIASEQKAEEKYTANTVRVHVEHAKEEGEKPGSGFLKALSSLANKFKLGQKKEPVLLEAEDLPEPEPDIVPRAPDQTDGLLDNAAVDWVGFGREFKTTVYEIKIPNLQKSFFNHGGLRLSLYEDFMALAEATLKFYSEAGYLKTTNHKVGVNVDGNSVIKSFEDSAIYLQTDLDTILVLGETPFSKNTEPVIYFQLYRTNPHKPHTGTTKKVDYSRIVEGTKFELESLEEAVPARPPLFQALIRVIDSLPDEIRNQHQDLLRGLYRFLEENTPSEVPDRRQI